MYEKGLILNIKNASFMSPDDVEANLLEEVKQNKSNLSTIIFGRNGSGKSTICKSIYSMMQPNLKINYAVDIKDNSGKNFTSEMLGNIRIYSEFFVDNNIRFKEDGLGTIVLLGENVQVDEQIELLSSKKDELNKKIDKINLSIYEDPNHVSNPVYNMNRMIRTLKQENNWTVRQKYINHSKNNVAVNADVVKRIADNHNEVITMGQFNEKLKEYIVIKENSSKCNYVFSDLEKVDLETIKEILKTKISKKSNDEIANEIYNVISNYGKSRIEEIKNTLESETKTCPYCFQPLNSEYKEKIVTKIKEIISNEAREIQEKIESLIIKKFEFLELPKIISAELKLQLLNSVEKYNDEVEIINKLLQKKIEDIYSIIEFNENNFMTSYSDLVCAIQNIVIIINNHNELIDDIVQFKKRLSDWNNGISWLTIKDEYQDYLKNVIEKENREDLHSKLLKEKECIENELIELRSKKRSVEIAVKEINKSLSFVFLSKDRLQLIPNGNSYKVMSKGKDIKIKDLSTGERNVIALCYYFTSIGEGKDVRNWNKEEYLCIIDDPISSFDSENKIGIYSLIRKMVNKILEGNANSRFIFMTHNYEVAYNLDKVIKDVGKEMKINKNGIAIGKRLSEFELEPLDISQGKNQYSVLMKSIYTYAKNPNPSSDYVIGNEIRRMLEMFASFEYNSNFESLTYKCGNSPLYELLNNYMFRIIANNESHTMLDAYAYDQIDRFESFNQEEKVKAAKLSLLLIGTLNSNHLEAYLDETAEVLNWKQEFKELL